MNPQDAPCLNTISSVFLLSGYNLQGGLIFSNERPWVRSLEYRLCALCLPAKTLTLDPPYCVRKVVIRASVTREYDRPFLPIVVGFWSSAVRMNHRQLEYKFLSIRTGTRYLTLAAQFSSNNHDVVTCHPRTPPTLRSKRQRAINHEQSIGHNI